MNDLKDKFLTINKRNDIDTFPYAFLYIGESMVQEIGYV